MLAKFYAGVEDFEGNCLCPPTPRAKTTPRGLAEVPSKPRSLPGFGDSNLGKKEDTSLLKQPLVVGGGPTKLQEEAIQYLRRSNKFLIALAIAITVVLPTVMYCLVRSLHVSGFQAEVVDQSKELDAYTQLLGTEESKRTKDISAVQKNIESGASAWAASTSASSQNMAKESAVRERDVAALDAIIKQVDERTDTESSQRGRNAKQASKLVDEEIAEYEKEFPGGIAAVKKNLRTETSKRASAIPPMTQAVDSYTQNSTWWQPIAPVNKSLVAQSSERRKAIAGLNDDIGGWTNFEDSLYFLNQVELKIKEGVCTYCVMCGGKWPANFGGVAAKLHSTQRRAEHCEGEMTSFTGEESFKVCCAMV